MTQHIYNVHIKFDNVRKYTIWMNKNILENVLSYYNQPLQDSNNYIISIHDKDIGIIYCKIDNDWGMYMLSNDPKDDQPLKYIYCNMDLFIHND